MKRVLAVGERLNAPTWRPATPENALSFELRIKIGLYNSGHRREFLNLLWPDPQGAPWCAAEARRVANALSRYVLAAVWSASVRCVRRAVATLRVRTRVEHRRGDDRLPDGVRTAAAME